MKIEEELKYKQLTANANQKYTNLLLRPKYVVMFLYFGLLAFWILMIISSVLTLTNH